MGPFVSTSNPARSALTILMNVLVIVAIILTVTIVVEFFGALSSRDWGEAIVKVGSLLTFPLGVEAYKTPYGGVLDIDAALTVAVVLFAEWGLSVARSRS
jgi:hypothetical protein